MGFLLSLKKVLGPHSLFATEVTHTPITTSFREGINLRGTLNRPRPGPWQSWASKDKGSTRTLTEFDSVKINKPEGIRRIDEFPNMTDEMLSRRWSEDRILKVLGGNWLRVLGEVWH